MTTAFEPSPVQRLMQDPRLREVRENRVSTFIRWDLPLVGYRSLVRLSGDQAVTNLEGNRVWLKDNGSGWLSDCCYEDDPCAYHLRCMDRAMEETAPFAVGDTVRLKSGGPVMTVENPKDAEGKVAVVWFNSGPAEFPHYRAFTPSLLVPCDAPAFKLPKPKPPKNVREPE